MVLPMQSQAGQTSCNACGAVGKFDDTTGGTACKTCPAGKVVGEASVAGTGNTSCTACHASGMYQNLAGQAACASCGVGRYIEAHANGSVGAGNQSCKYCALGTHQDASGQGSCKTCASGKYADASMSDGSTQLRRGLMWQYLYPKKPW